MDQGSERKRALIISVSRYERLQPLDFCENGGLDLYEYLKSAGYEITDKDKLIGEVKWVDLRDAITDFFTDTNIRPNDTLIFYFSGHGVPGITGEDTYLATSEIDPNNPVRKGYSFLDLARIMNMSISKRIVTILDCCYSGGASLVGGIPMGDQNAAERVGRAAINMNSKILEQGEGKCLLAASSATQQAYGLKQSGYSIFSYYLLEGLKGANGQSIDREGRVTPDTLGTYVFEKVVDIAPNQRPIKKVEMAGNIVLAYHPELLEKIPAYDRRLESNLIEGDKFYFKEDYEESIRYYDKVIEIDRNNVSAWHKKSKALYALDRYDEAKKCYDEILLINPNHFDALYKKGNILRINHEYAEALKCYDKALKINQDALNVWLNKASIHDDLGEYKEALECYEKCTKLRTNDSNSWYKKGRCLYNLKQYPDAIECYDKAIEYDYSRGDAWYEKGRILYDQNKKDEARKCFERSLELNKNFVDKWYEVKSPADQVVAGISPKHTTKELVEPVKEPVVEPVKEPVVEPVKEPVVEPVKEPVVEPTTVEPTTVEKSQSPISFPTTKDSNRFQVTPEKTHRSKTTFPIIIALVFVSIIVFIVFINPYFHTPTTNEPTTPSQPTTPCESQVCFVRAWGSFGSGDGQFNSPADVAVDATDYVYVADEGNNRIQKFTSDGKFITTWGSSGKGEGQFDGPIGVAVDSSGNVYVTDWRNNRVQKFTSDGKFITTWGSSGKGNGQFDEPMGIAVDSSGNIYVSERVNDRVQKFTSDGKFITTWGSSGDGKGQFNSPSYVAVDFSGDVFIADDFNDRVQKFTSDGKFITTWGSFGEGDGQFNNVAGIAVDSSSNVYVADFDRIQKFTNDGNFITKWGSSGTGEGQLNSTAGIDVVRSANVYVSEWNNDRIQVFRQVAPESNIMSSRSNMSGGTLGNTSGGTLGNMSGGTLGNMSGIS